MIGALASDVALPRTPVTVKVYGVCGSSPDTTALVPDAVATCLPLANSRYDVAPALGRHVRDTVVRLTSVAVTSAGLPRAPRLFGVIL